MLSVLVLSFICLPLLAQIRVPQIGTARYPDGSLHTVQGLPANMIVADLPLDTAEAASFSDSGGLVSQKGIVRLLAADFSVVAEYAAAEKPLLSIDGKLTSALAWLPNAHTLLHWNGSDFDRFSVASADIDGTVTDIQSSGSNQAKFIVQHPDNSVSAVIISLRTGNLVSSESLPGVHGYTFGQGCFVVSASEKDLAVDDLRGYRRTIPIPSQDFLIERMSNNWLHVFSPSMQRSWALHLTQAALQLSLLPGLPQQRAGNFAWGIK
jgi:hypothetical protein